MVKYWNCPSYRWGVGFCISVMYHFLTRCSWDNPVDLHLVARRTSQVKPAPGLRNYLKLDFKVASTIRKWKKVKQHQTLLPQNCFPPLKRDDLPHEIKLTGRWPYGVNYEDVLFIFYIQTFHPIQCSRATQVWRLQSQW